MGELIISNMSYIILCCITEWIVLQIANNYEYQIEVINKCSYVVRFIIYFFMWSFDVTLLSWSRLWWDDGLEFLYNNHCIVQMVVHSLALVEIWMLSTQVHDGVIKWKHFPRYWPFVRGIHQSPVNSPHKGQWRGALILSLIFAWINSRVNNREAGDLRCHCAHYDVTIMFKWILVIDGWGTSCEITLRWMFLDLIDDNSTLIQVMARCGQVTSHYLRQCWPRYVSPYCVTRPQWVNNLLIHVDKHKAQPYLRCLWQSIFPNVSMIVFLTPWGWDKIATMKTYKFRWSLFPRVQLIIFKHWFR